MPDNGAGDRQAADQDTQEMRSVSQTRRNLLKAAVIGSAAVAATAGAGAAAAAMTGRQELNPLNQIAWIMHGSPGDPCAVCTTGTNYSTLDTLSGKQGLFLWLRFLNVPAGAYSFDLSPTILSSSATCPTSTPFRYHDAHGSVTLWVLPQQNYECHPNGQSELSGVPHTSFDALPNNPSYTINATQCLLVQVAVDYFCASGNHTYTMTGYLKQGSTVKQSCTHQITIS